MNITEVRIKLTNKEDSKIKAVASVTIDACFVIHDILVIEKEEGFKVCMPNKKNAVGKFTDIAHPINAETRELFNKTVLDAYEKAKTEEQPA